MPFMSDALDTFLAHWTAAEASERANAQQFLVELADLLDVPRPANSHTTGYTFEFPVRIPCGDGTSSEGRIDLEWNVNEVVILERVH